MELKGFSEFLNEMSTVFRNDDVLCTVNPGVGRIGDSYFKLYDSNSFESGLGNSEFDCLNKTIELKNNKYLRLDLQIPNYCLL